MSGTFTKSILRVGTYHGPDGVVRVTPKRLRHWERETRKLQSVGYAIPSHFDHASELELLEPIAMDVLARGQNRSAAATVGRLESFKVLPDGQSAEIMLHTLTPKAAEVVGSNAVYVSPVIFPEWKDGAGNVYRDVITSFDLVDHPVDYSQTSFVPAVRMGLNSKPFFLSGVRRMSSLTNRRKRPTRMGSSEKADGFYTTPSGQVRPITVGGEEYLDDDHKPAGPSKKWRNKEARKNRSKKKKMGLFRMGVAEDATDANEQEDAVAEAAAAMVEPEAVDDFYDSLDEVLDLLEEFGVTLPDDTDDDSVMQNLRAALTALLSARLEDADDDLLGDSGALPTASGTDTPVASAPNIATLSVQQRALLTYAETIHKNAVAQRLQLVLKSGRCTPAEADKQQRLLHAVKLNLTAAGMPATTDVEKWLEAREAVPEGTFWTDKQRTQAAQMLSVVEPRNEWRTSGGQTKSEVDQAIIALGGKPN